MRQALLFTAFGLMQTLMWSIRNSADDDDDESVDVDSTERILEQTTVQGFESLVGSLATKVAHQGYNMSTEESEALNTIKKYLQDLFNKTQQQHQEDVTLMNESRQQIIECETDVAKVKTTNQGMHATANTSRAVHNSCRETEKALYDIKKNACAAWDSARLAVTDADMSCVCSSFTKDGFHNDESSTKDCLEGAGAKISGLLAAHRSCLNKTNNHSNQTASCENKQRDFEQAYCAYSLQNSDVCTTYRTCRPQKIAERNTTHAQVETRVAARKADYEAGKRTLCLFDVFTAADDEKVDKLKTCTDLSVDASHLDMVYPDIPPLDNFYCAPSDYAPCNTSWVADEYTSQSWYQVDQTVPAACTPCTRPGAGGNVSTCTFEPRSCKFATYDCPNNCVSDRSYSGMENGCYSDQGPMEFHGGWAKIGCLEFTLVAASTIEGRYARETAWNQTCVVEVFANMTRQSDQQISGGTVVDTIDFDGDAFKTFTSAEYPAGTKISFCEGTGNGICGIHVDYIKVHQTGASNAARTESTCTTS